MENHATNTGQPFSSLTYMGEKTQKIWISQKQKFEKVQVGQIDTITIESWRKQEDRKKKLNKKTKPTNIFRVEKPKNGWLWNKNKEKDFLEIKGIIDQIKFNRSIVITTSRTENI